MIEGGFHQVFSRFIGSALPKNQTLSRFLPLLLHQKLVRHKRDACNRSYRQEKRIITVRLPLQILLINVRVLWGDIDRDMRADLHASDEAFFDRECAAPPRRTTMYGPSSCFVIDSITVSTHSPCSKVWVRRLIRRISKIKMIAPTRLTNNIGHCSIPPPITKNNPKSSYLPILICAPSPD